MLKSEICKLRIKIAQHILHVADWQIARNIT